jgi:hypothetical protein
MSYKTYNFVRQFFYKNNQLKIYVKLGLYLDDVYQMKFSDNF